jgi:hypothetical protein
LQKITYKKDEITFEVISYDKKCQTIKVKNVDSGQMESIAFAHVPRNVKKLINPKKK